MFNIKEEQQAQYYQNGGEFLPLSVWAARHFDANVIKEKIAQEDCREHPVLGTTYRAKILSMGDRGEKLTRARQVLSAKVKRSTMEAECEKAQSDAGEDKDEDKKGAKATSAAQKAEKDDKDDSDADNSSIDSDASSDDSSSNSSSGKKKKNNHKKSKTSSTKKKKKSKKGKKAKKYKKVKKEKIAKERNAAAQKANKEADK